MRAQNTEISFCFPCDDDLDRNVLRSDLSDACRIALWLEIFTCRNLDPESW